MKNVFNEINDVIALSNDELLLFSGGSTNPVWRGIAKAIEWAGIIDAARDAYNGFSDGLTGKPHA